MYRGDKNRVLIKDESGLRRKQTDLDELTYIMSHDLQEPLRMIRNYVQLLSKKYNDKIDDDGREYIKYALDGSNRLKQMMDDLLTYSKICNSAVNIGLINIGDLMENVRILLRPKYKDNSYSVDFKLNGEDKIQADKDLLIKLFYNVIENALKFNQNKNPEIMLSVLDSNIEWIFSVKDNGIGIDKDYHGKIFRIFQKLHNYTEYPGTGTGLAICEKIAEMHNGRIWVESEKDKGAVFYIAIQKEINC